MPYEEHNLCPRGWIRLTLPGGVRITIKAKPSTHFHDAAIGIEAPRNIQIERDEIHHIYLKRRQRNASANAQTW